MSDDIVTRLRQALETDESILLTMPRPTVQMMANEIERLRRWASYEHAGYCGCAGGDQECVERAYTTWKKMFDE